MKTRRVSCPHMPGKEIEVIGGDTREEMRLVRCKTYIAFRQSGGTQTNGCGFLPLHAIHECPFEKGQRYVGLMSGRDVATEESRNE